MVLSDSYSWANDIFGSAEVGDLRRTRRLVTLASSLAQHTGLSIVQSSHSTAEVEGAYRLMRNPAVLPDAIADAGFTATARAAAEHPLLLALEDSTSLNFGHSTIREELGSITNSQRARGLQVHSVLLYAPGCAHMVGLIEQQRWSRESDSYGKKHQRKQRPYEEKESYKWQKASEHMAQRLGEIQSRVISVCDREADIWHYLDYKLSQRQRFVVRAAQNRLLAEAPGKLFSLPEHLTEAGSHTLNVVQKGGRAARQTQMFISYNDVQLKKTTGEAPLSLTYICCREADPEGACWHLLTSEKVENTEQARAIVGYYERRWLIEEYHKAWKSGGAQVEQLRMQTRDNLERMVTILAFVAVRVLALRQGGVSEETQNESCESVLSQVEWKLLWMKQEGKALPESPPPLKWACQSLAKLGRWYDSKRTGRPGWIVIWDGWFKLQDMVEGYRMAKSLDQEI
ncbi:TPA: IS4 family transposase [Salmonella enterica subsp. salamae serovar 28:r:e,n,z15]|nr:IS4 family transposase [Salmonella enterica subsp. salamae serovar 28:r:e,n,z15]